MSAGGEHPGLIERNRSIYLERVRQQFAGIRIYYLNLCCFFRHRNFLLSSRTDLQRSNGDSLLECHGNSARSLPARLHVQSDRRGTAALLPSNWSHPSSQSLRLRRSSFRRSWPLASGSATRLLSSVLQPSALHPPPMSLATCEFLHTFRSSAEDSRSRLHSLAAIPTRWAGIARVTTEPPPVFNPSSFPSTPTVRLFLSRSSAMF